MTINFSVFCQLFSGSGQILEPRQFYRSPGLAKIAPWWLDRRDYFLPKVPGHVTADGATNVYCPYQRAVIVNGGQSARWTTFQPLTITEKASHFTETNFCSFYRDLTP